MEVTESRIKGLLLLRPKVFRDERGYFFESYRSDILMEAGLNLVFVQDNESKSQKGVLRGLHFQKPPHSQGKLVRVIKGAVLDVAVDIRKDSPTYGQHMTYELTEDNKTMLWIPEGFAHGFLTLENDTIFQYKCTGYYNKEAEGSIRWNDPELGIDWQILSPVVSDKDKNAPLFRELHSKF